MIDSKFLCLTANNVIKEENEKSKRQASIIYSTVLFPYFLKCAEAGLYCCTILNNSDTVRIQKDVPQVNITAELLTYLSHQGFIVNSLSDDVYLVRWDF